MSEEIQNLSDLYLLSTSLHHTYALLFRLGISEQNRSAILPKLEKTQRAVCCILDEINSRIDAEVKNDGK